MYVIHKIHLSKLSYIKLRTEALPLYDNCHLIKKKLQKIGLLKKKYYKKCNLIGYLFKFK